MNTQQPITMQSLRTNAILRVLTAAGAGLVLKRGALVHVSLRDEIYESEQTICDVYFPIDSVLSIVARMRDGSHVEIGTIGREGMSAAPLLMGAVSTANICYCQVPGRAIRLPVELFRYLAKSDPGFHQMLDRYLQAYMNILGQLAACNRLHSIYERCARWLLMTRDRVDIDAIPLTQEFLAMMLGTGRSGVGIAAAALQQSGFIKCTHGVMTILDRRGLEEAACECYDVARKQFDLLMRSGSGSRVKNDIFGIVPPAG